MDKFNYCIKASRVSSGKSKANSSCSYGSKRSCNSCSLLTKQEKQKLLQQAQLKHLFNLGSSSSSNNGVIKCNNSSNNNVKRSSSLMVVSNKYVSKRKCEPFQRISASSLVRYLSINNQINVSSLSTSENQSNNVSSNVSMYITHKCVLFDLRSLDEYDMYHIRTAYNYPCVNIARDRFPTEMLLNKNKPNTYIIIYHTNEKSGIEYATHLYDKGFDNIYYLTGGIENFIRKYPEHIEGEYKEYLITLKREAQRIQRETLLLRQGKRESKYHPCYRHKLILNNSTNNTKRSNRLNKSSSVDVIGLIPSEKNFILSLRHI